MSLSYDNQDYRDTTDPDLFDLRVWSIASDTRFDVSQTTRLNLSLGLEDSAAQDASMTNDRTYSASLGLSQDLSPIDTLDARLGYTLIDTVEEDLISTTYSSVSGLTGAVGLTREMRNGTASVDLELDVTPDGTTTTLLFGRAVEMRSGALDANIGFGWLEGGAAHVIGNASYSRELPNGSIGAEFSRSVSVNGDDEDVVATRLGLEYAYMLNDVSGFGLTYDWSAQGDGGAGSAESILHQTLDASYSRELTPDWDLTGGYRRRMRDDDSGHAVSNSIYLTLSRSYEYR